MPSTDDFEPTFDNFDEQPPVAAAPPAAEPEDPWGFGKSPPKPKKKKGKKHAKQNRVEEGEESSAYPKSITPSPPTEHGVKVPVEPPQPAQPTPPSPQLVNFEDDTTAVEDLQPSPALKPIRPSPSPSPVVRSPRPAVAKPVVAPSPPSRPVSLHGAPQRDRNNSLVGHRASPISAQPKPQRRESLASNRPRFVEPPPPHMPQAHFFGLPDLGLMGFGQKQETGKPAGSDGYCCRLDTLADAGDDASAKKARDALLVGCEGGLEVFRILSNKLEVVGRLEGLRGAAIGAKILPHTERLDGMQALRPLVAVVVHGPMLDDRRDSGPEGEDRDYGDADTPGHFQTTVEVYSLQGQFHVATLYSSAPVLVEQPSIGQVSSLPDPVGDLHLDAKGQYITVSSGKSGEVFVFTQEARGDIHTSFRCIGKFWTSVQKSLSSAASRPASSADSTTPLEVKEEPRDALLSLSQRWLAIVPPFSSSNISIQGVPLLSDINPSPPGITTHAAPPQSVVTCDVVGTDVEGTWSRLGRQAAQGLVKYSQKGIEMGWQGWKELTHPSPPGGRQSHDRSSSKEELFPPTNAPTHDPSRLAKEPALVSIIDLESLLHWEEHKPKYLSPPMATFAIVDGCNFLSMSSTGTRLLTSSRKGEVSTVWDLTQVAHGVPIGASSSDEDDISTSPCVKQLQRISRNSPSTVLECAWSKDDDALALLTAHGTIHLHEVLTRPLTKRRKRANTANGPAPEKADATVSVSSGMSPPSANQGFLAGIKSSWQSVSTQVNSIRSSNPASAFGLPTTFAGYKEAATAAGNAGSRVVARGLSQGYTAAKGGASDYWHADDNKIRHTKALQEAFSSKSLRWVKRNNTMSVAIACGGSIHVHPVQRVTRRKGDSIVSGLKHERYAHKAFPLPPITTRTEVGGAKLDSCTNQGPHGFWSLRNPSPPPTSDRKSGMHPTKPPQGQGNEVETNPPYCPFHVDARVNIFAFEEESSGSQYGPSMAYYEFQIQGHGLEDEEPWLFGDALPQSTKINERIDDFHEPGAMDEEDDENEDFAAQMESRLTIQPARKNQGSEQIRINTRRRMGKGKGGGKAIDADDDFDVLLEDDDSII